MTTLRRSTHLGFGDTGGFIARIFVSALLLYASPSAAQTIVEQPDQGVRVTYLANEGFSISHGADTLLVDALFGSGIAGYPTVPPEFRRALEEGNDGKEGVRIALATHFHGDHFDPRSVARFLSHNQTAVFISTPQSISALVSHLGADSDLLSRARSVFPKPGTSEKLEIAGIAIEVLNLHHGDRTPPVENLGFVIGIGGARVIHLGDTEAELDDFEPYFDHLRDVDVALLPFWFLTSEWRRDMVKETIRPRAIVAAHLPEATAPATYFGRWQSHQGLITLIARDFPAAHVPRLSGDTWMFPAEP